MLVLVRLHVLHIDSVASYDMAALVFIQEEGVAR